MKKKVTYARYALVTFPESQRFMDNEDRILVIPNLSDDAETTDFDDAYLVPEATAKGAGCETYLRIPWPKSQKWQDVKVTEPSSVLFDYYTHDAYVKESFFYEHTGKQKRPKPLNIEQLEREIRRRNRFENRCMALFISTVKEHLAAHPELPDGKIYFDPDATFIAQNEHKYGMTEVGDIVAVSIHEKGYLVFDISTEYDLETKVPLSYETASYCGIYVEDWTYALKVLLQQLENPYTPEN